MPLLLALAAVFLVFGIVGKVAPDVMWPMTFFILGGAALMVFAGLIVDGVAKRKTGIVAGAGVVLVLGLASGAASIAVDMQHECEAEAGSYWDDGVKDWPFGPTRDEWISSECNH